MNGFLEALREDMTDLSLWRIYYDWLQEAQDPLSEKVKDIIKIFEENKGTIGYFSKIKGGTRDDRAICIEEKTVIWILRNSIDKDKIEIERNYTTPKMWKKTKIVEEVIKEFIV